MRVIVAGSRSITDYETVKVGIEKSNFTITEVVSGGAVGVDRLGEKWANEHSIPIKYFLPEWSVYGKAAGPLRNSDMAAYAEALIAIHDGISRGTANMILQMQNTGKQVFVYAPTIE